MKDWTRPPELRARLQKLWDRGELLTGLVSREHGFPRRFPLRTPTAGEMSGSFEAVRAWVGELTAMSGFRLEMREVAHRVLGANQVPCAAWLDSLDDAFTLIGKRREAKRFAGLVEATREREPAMMTWLAKRPLRALEAADDWPFLLDVVAWMKAHPRPGIFVRQVDIPGVHSKFIETNRALLAELFELVLSPEAIVRVFPPGRFAARFGFREKPERVRLRVLDASLRLLSGVPDPCSAASPTHGCSPDVTLDAESFAVLEIPVKRVFITENETNFLAFPRAPESIVLFGAGYGWEALAGAGWLKRCEILYWGDIDTHGFAILDQLRGIFPHVESMLMDRETLLAHRPLWGHEEKPTLAGLSRLTPTEGALYDDLRDNRLGDRVRLEQERIAFGRVEAAVHARGTPCTL